MRWNMRLTTVLAAIYTIWMMLWLILLQTPVATGGIWEVSRAIGSWFYTPLWVLLGVSLLRRNHRAATILLVPLLFFAANYGRQFLPNWHLLLRDTRGTIPVRVMSWNSYYANDDTAAFEAAVRALQPDLIAIQEAGTQFSADLPHRLGDLFPYQELYPTGGAAGMAILSNYPILSAAPPDFRRGGTSCNCQTITVDVQGQAVTVINMHPWPARMRFRRLGPIPVPTDYDTSNQDRLIQLLAEAVQGAESPLLVLGDLNTSELQPNYQRLRVHLQDAFAQTGWGLGYTFPSNKRFDTSLIFPFIRIDYVFHDRAWIARAAWTGAIHGSDHRYVVADLLLSPSVSP